MATKQTTCDLNPTAASPTELAPILSGFLCLIDQTGRIVASGEPVFGGEFKASREVVKEIIQSPQFNGALAAARETGTAVITFVANDVAPAYQIHVRRMEGDEGGLVLVAINFEAPADTSDALTGLPDRRAIAQRIAAWQTEGVAHTLPFALLFVDLDDLKRVNDHYGHLAGDRALVEVAQRLAKCVREGDLVARFGGDEFVILLRNVSTFAESASVRNRIEAAMSPPLCVSGKEFQLSVSVGAAIAQAEEVSLEQLVEAADREMYAHKRQRRSS